MEARSNEKRCSERRSKMRNSIISIAGIAFLISSHPAFAQEVDLKQKALEEFRAENHQAAIALLKQAVKKNPDDAELYYYLGYFTHYLCYDSVPLVEYSREKSDEVLRYLEKAISLNPKLGDVYYFIGAEYGARSYDAMQRGDVKEIVNSLRAGREKGGYPDWLIEFGRNILRSCKPNAILLTGGDADTTPIWYLQWVENYRRDVCVIPVALLGRPWFARLLKHGLIQGMSAAPIRWSDEQILDMHPYKWKSTKLEIDISNEELKRYQVSPGNTKMSWELKPDLVQDSQELLSPARALIAEIVQANQWRRPIYFSVGCSQDKLANLDGYLQLTGLARRLTPYEVARYHLSIDAGAIEEVLLQRDHYRDLASVRTSDMPRASGLLQNYRYVLLHLATNHLESGRREKAKEVLDKMDEYIPDSIWPMGEGDRAYVNSLRSKVEGREK